MRHPVTAATAVSALCLGLFTGGPLSAVAAAEPGDQPAPGRYVDHVEWAKWGDLSSLRVYPTPAARVAAGEIGTTVQGDEAWDEVLTRAPEADQPGMQDQFRCHWQLAEFAQPGKTSWNLEPWRPEVEYLVMLETGCNPGGTEEPF